MASLGRIVAELMLDTAKFQSGLSRAEHQTAQFAKSVDRAVGDAGRAFIGFAAQIASVGAVMVEFKAALDYATQIDKLVKQTGIAAEELDQLGIVAKQNGTEVSGLVRTYKELSESIVKAGDTSSREAQIFEKLGISLKDGKGNAKGMTEVWGELAGVFANSTDQTGNLVVAQALLGKAGAEMVPILRAWTEEQERAKRVQEAFGAVTDDVREGADNFGDAIDLLREGIQRSFYPTIESMGNALMRVADEFINLGKQGTALGPVFDFLRNMGTAAVEVFGAVAIAADSLLRSIGTMIGGLAAAAADLLSGRGLVQAWNTLKESYADSSKIIDDSNAAIARVLDRTKQVAPAADKAASSNNKMAAAAKAAAQSVTTKGKALEDAAAHVAAYNKYLTEQAELEAKSKIAADAFVRSLDEMVEKYRLEADAVGKSALSLELLNLERERERALIGPLSSEVRDLINARYDEARSLILARNQRELDIRSLESSSAAFAESQRVIEQFGDKAVDVFADVLHGGRDAFTRLADTIKSTVLRLIAELTIKPIVVRLAASILGVTPGVASAGGGDLLSSIFGGGGGGPLGGLMGSLFGGAGSFFTGLGGNFFGGIGGALGNIGIEGLLAGTAGNLSAGFTALGAGNILGGLGTMLGTAIPYVGMAVAIAGALGLFDGGGGPKSGGFAQSGGLNLERFFTPNDQDSMLQGIVDNIKLTYEEAIKNLGGKGIADFAIGFDTDPEGTASNRLVSQAYVDGKLVYDYKSGDDSLGRDADALKTAIDLESKRALLAALQASELPAEVSAVLNSLVASTASAEDIENIVGVANAVKNIVDILARDPLADLQEALDTSRGGPLYVLGKMGEALHELMAEFDGSAESAEALASATADYYNAQLQLLAQLEGLRESLTGPEGLFADTRRQLAYQTLPDDRARYEFLQNEAARYEELLRTATDPEDIDRYARRINDLMVESFNLLTPEQQAAQLDQFIAGLDALDTLTQERIDDVTDTVLTSVEGVMDEVRVLLEGIADKMDGSADKTLAAADKFVIAANTPHKVDVIVSVEGGSEVNA